MPDIEVEGPGGSSISFPEGTGADVIHQVMSEHFGAQPAPTTNPMQQMTIDFQNQMRAAAQGTSPIISAHAPNLLSDQVEFDEADRPLFKDQSGNLIPFNPRQHVMLQDPADRKLKVFGRADETNEGRLAGLGRFILGGQGPGAIRGAAAIPEAISAAGRIGVDVPKAIATESPLVQLTGQTLAKAPGGGPLYKAVQRGGEQLGEATTEAIERSGGTPDAQIAGESFRKGINEYFKPGIKQVVGNLYDKVDAGVDQNALHPLTKTTDIAGDIAGRHAGFGDLWSGKGADLIINAIQKPEGLTYQSIKNLRTHVGEMLDTGTFPEGTSENELRKVYAGLSDDLRTSVQTAGSPQALTDFERANAAASQAEQWKDKLQKVIGSEQRSDEGIAGTIFRLAQNGQSADLNALSAARKAVPASAWQDVTANAISRLGKDKAGTFSPTRFVSDYGNLSEAGKRILFGGAGSSDLVPFLNDISEVSKKFVAAGKFANPSGTAGHVGMYSAMTVAGERLLEGDWKTPLAILGTGLGANITARLLATPSTVASVARWSRAYDALLNKPGPAALASFGIATRNLSNTAAGHARIPAAELQQRIQQAIQVANPDQNQPSEAQTIQ